MFGFCPLTIPVAVLRIVDAAQGNVSLRVLRLGLALLLISAPTVGQANELACRPNVRERIYAFQYVRLNGMSQAAFHNALERYAERKRFRVSGGGWEDPDQQPPYVSQHTILQSSAYGIVIVAETSNRSRYAFVTVGNNCWAKAEPWKATWAELTSYFNARRPGGKRSD